MLVEVAAKFVDAVIVTVSMNSGPVSLALLLPGIAVSIRCLHELDEHQLGCCS